MPPAAASCEGHPVIVRNLFRQYFPPKDSLLSNEYYFWNDFVMTILHLIFVPIDARCCRNNKISSRFKSKLLISTFICDVIKLKFVIFMETTIWHTVGIHKVQHNSSFTFLNMFMSVLSNHNRRKLCKYFNDSLGLNKLPRSRLRNYFAEQWHLLLVKFIPPTWPDLFRHFTCPCRCNCDDNLLINRELANEPLAVRRQIVSIVPQRKCNKFDWILWAH
jgi:hypothetical protein